MYGGNKWKNKEPRTEIVHGSENVVDCLVQFIRKAKLRIDVCVDHTRPGLAIEISRLGDTFIDAKKRHVKVRYITEITKHNLDYCKELIPLVDEFRHLNGIKGNFYISEEEYAAPATLHEKGKSSEMMIYSNIKEIVEHQQYIFDSFWNTSTSAERKITEIQNDISLGITEIIDNPSRTQELFINLIKSAKSEILLILPTINAFMREHRIGVIQLSNELSTTPEGAVNVRILTPTNNKIDKIIEEMKTSTSTISKTSLPKEETIGSLSSDNFNNSHLKIRHLESQPEFNVTTVTILIVDRKASLVIEKVDDSKESFIEAVGLSTYSTSQPTVISYLSIFENFWNQVELYEKLKEHDKMQKEFINIAAHELRTPAQSILGYAEMAKVDPNYIEKHIESFIDVIYRNGLRIHKLTKDILDVTRIESHTLNLDKIKFNLKDVIKGLVDDVQPVADTGNNKVKIVHRSLRDREGVDNHGDNVFVQADRDRITQVISNLLDNALKFTHQGLVSIAVSTTKEYKQGQEEGNEKEVVVSVEDSGSGIDPEMFPKLFTKFSTKSFSGTGLGLYISKSIIEAHGGKIWAKNNNEPGKCGATFSFSIPLVLT
jgi:two-component system sensor histidine kinase VicK